MSDHERVVSAGSDLMHEEAGVVAPPRTSALSPFRHRTFRDVWIANVASQFGGLIQLVGASWLMLSIGASAEMVTLVQASTTLPFVMFALLAGALADNLDQRRMMIAAYVFVLVASTALAAVAYFALITPWLLLSFTFLIGVGTAFIGPAWLASVSEIVPRQDLPSAVALNSIGFNAARSVGPAIGGVVVAAAGAAAAFALNALSYIGIVVVLARWRRPPEQRRLPPERLDMAMIDGIRYAAMSPNIGSILVRGFVFGAGAGAITALMPLITRDLIGGDSVTYGMLLGVFGAGAIGGGFLSHRLRQLLSNEMIVRCGHLSFVVAAAVSAFSSWLPLTMAAMLLSGAGWVLVLATLNVAVQTSTPRWVMARALSLYQMVTFGGIAAGSWLWGLATGQWGIEAALLISAGVTLGGAALGWACAVPQTDALDVGPLGRWQEPEIALKIEPRSGPVVITIEYRIREEDIPEFLAAMADRRRIRRRDGARGWSLLRDLGDPEIWVERYHNPTWLDYVRHNQRTTQDDAAVWDRVRALHRGPDRPRVRRMIERPTGVSFGGPGAAESELGEPITGPARLP